MMRLCLFWSLLSLLVGPAAAQEIKMSHTAPLEQIYGETVEDDTLLPMNELDMDFGYALYETTVDVEEENPTLTIENVRDYAVVYADGKLQGYLKDSSKSLKTDLSIGIHKLSIYVENIGRITYGPEILDNSKGLFGSISLDDKGIRGWGITELKVRDCSLDDLVFDDEKENNLPAFHRGSFEMDAVRDAYLDISGWGMGEVWINGNYIGSYWEEDKQQSIQVPADILVSGSNEVVVFELKNKGQQVMRLSEEPVFK